MKRSDGQPRAPRMRPDQVAQIRERWATETSIVIAADIGVSPQLVKACASRLGLRKDRDALSEIRAAAAAKTRGVPKRVMPRSRTGRRATNPTPLGTHLAMLLGTKPVELPTCGGRVHLIELDEERIAA